ncbi:hypothetical protein LRC537489_31410 [Mycobacterium riyadhense]
MLSAKGVATDPAITRLIVHFLIGWRGGAAMDARPACLKTDLAGI